MAAYTTVEAIEAKVPAPILDDALDDDKDGRRDAGVIEQVIANASEAVEAMICNRVALPLASVPASVRNAALWFAVEEIYGRRQAEMPEVYTKAVSAARAWLEQVRSGKEQLDATAPVVLKAGGGGNPYVPGRVPVAGSPTNY
jgi:phage gp36-like protein